VTDHVTFGSTQSQIRLSVVFLQRSGALLDRLKVWAIFFANVYISRLLTSAQIYTEIIPGKPFPHDVMKLIFAVLLPERHYVTFGSLLS